VTDIDVTDFDGPRTADGELHPDLPPLVLPATSNPAELMELLERQQSVKYDRVLVADDMRMENGYLVVRNGVEATIDEDGVIPEHDLVMSPTALFDDQIATRLDIPREYMRRLRLPLPRVHG
jgi:hypothetical protein